MVDEVIVLLGRVEPEQQEETRRPAGREKGLEGQGKRANLQPRWEFSGRSLPPRLLLTKGQPQVAAELGEGYANAPGPASALMSRERLGWSSLPSFQSLTGLLDGFSCELWTNEETYRTNPQPPFATQTIGEKI